MGSEERFVGDGSQVGSSFPFASSSTAAPPINGHMNVHHPRYPPQSLHSSTTPPPLPLPRASMQPLPTQPSPPSQVASPPRSSSLSYHAAPFSPSSSSPSSSFIPPFTDAVSTALHSPFAITGHFTVPPSYAMSTYGGSHAGQGHAHVPSSSSSTSPSLSSSIASSSSSSSSSSAASAAASSSSSHLASLYKTELCKSWQALGSCKYSTKCKFAHGVEELVPVQRHKKYKTEPCRNFSQDGHCRYGDRCKFIHEGEPVNVNNGVVDVPHIQQPQQQRTNHSTRHSPQLYHSPTPSSLYAAQSPVAAAAAMGSCDLLSSSLALPSPHLPATAVTAATVTPPFPALLNADGGSPSLGASIYRYRPASSSAGSPTSSSSSTSSGSGLRSDSTPPTWLHSVYNTAREREPVHERIDRGDPPSASSAWSASLLFSPRSHSAAASAAAAAREPERRQQSFPSTLPFAGISSSPPPPSTQLPLQPSWSDANSLRSALRSLHVDEVAELPQRNGEVAGWLPHRAISVQQQQQNAHAQEEEKFHAAAYQASATAAGAAGAASASSSQGEGELADPSSFYHLQRSILNDMTEAEVEDVGYGYEYRQLDAVHDSFANLTALRQLRNAHHHTHHRAQAEQPPHGSARFRSQSLDQQRPSSASSGASSRVGSTQSSPHGPAFFDNQESPEPFQQREREERNDSRFSSAYPPGLLHRSSPLMSQFDAASMSVNSSGGVGGAAAAAALSSRLFRPVLDTSSPAATSSSSSSSSSRFVHAPGKAVSPPTGSSSSSLSPRRSAHSPPLLPLGAAAASGLPAMSSAWSERSSSFSSSASGGGGVTESISTTRASSYAAGSPLLLGHSPFSTSPFSPTTASNPPPHFSLPRAALAQLMGGGGSPALNATTSSKSSSPHIGRLLHRRSEDLTREDKEAEDSPLDSAFLSHSQRTPLAAARLTSTSTSSSSSSTSGSSSPASPFVGSSSMGLSSPSSPWHGSAGLQIIDDQPQPPPPPPALRTSPTHSTAAATVLDVAAVFHSTSPSSRRPPPVRTPSTPSSASAKSGVEGNWRIRPGQQQ